LKDLAQDEAKNELPNEKPSMSKPPKSRIIASIVKPKMVTRAQMKIQSEGLLKVRTKLRSCQVVLGLMTILDIINTYMISVE
jgi:hypothetical protein